MMHRFEVHQQAVIQGQQQFVASKQIEALRRDRGRYVFFADDDRGEIFLVSRLVSVKPDSLLYDLLLFIGMHPGRRFSFQEVYDACNRKGRITTPLQSQWCYAKKRDLVNKTGRDQRGLPVIDRFIEVNNGLVISPFMSCVLLRVGSTLDQLPLQNIQG